MANESKSGALNFSSREELQAWLESLPPEQGRWVAVAIAARTALRVLPLVMTDAERKRGFENLTFTVFFATALARVAAVYPTHANELRANSYAAAAAANAAAASYAAAAAADAASNAAAYAYDAAAAYAYDAANSM